MSISCANLARQIRAAALLGAAFALIAAPPIAAAVECPDPPTVSAAQLLEFKTMMMVVGLRCKSVGVMMADHNDEMAAMRTTMFEEADRRVRRYIVANDQPVPVPIAPPVPVAIATGAGAKAKVPGKGPVGARGKVPARGRASAVGKGPAKTAAKGPAKSVGKGPSKVIVKAPGNGVGKAPGNVAGKAPGTVLVKAPTAALAKAAPKARPLAPRSRRDDPYEKYLTRVGTSYGMGDNSLGTCRNYDALVSYLADPTTPNRELTVVAARLIGTPVLEKRAVCPTKP